MTEYVAGFMFEGDRVALVVKNRPAWQAGKMNGIGGHVELGEFPHQAMVREFYEETGVSTSTDDWFNFVRLEGTDFAVEFFFAHGKLSALKSTTDKQIVKTPVDHVRADNAIPNLTWLIPMAKTMSVERAVKFTIKEWYS